MASNQAASSIVTGISSFFNKKKAPPVIDYKEVDPEEEQKKSLLGNIANEDTIEQLLSRANGYTQDQANSLMEKAMPGYSALSQKLLGTASANLDDPYALPEDVSKNLTRLAAERGVSLGTSGQTNDFGLLRDFGVNSMAYGESRINQAQSLISAVAAMAPKVNPISPLSFYVSPGQQIATTTDNNTKTQAILQGGANAATAAKNWNTQNFWNTQIAAAEKADSTAQYGWEQFKDVMGMFMGSGMMGGMGGGG